MADIRSKVNMLYSLEQLAAKNTVIHRIHPFAKLTVTMVYIFCAASFQAYDLTRLAPFFLYPAVIMTLAELPCGMILKRTMLALPFCLFAGISNLIFDHRVVFTAAAVPITGGMVSLLTLLVRTILCVCAVLILAAVTPFTELSGELRRLHVPAMFVTLLEMVYRYAGVLAGEAETMVTAFRLRSSGAKWPDITQFGAFVGQLLLRSADRAERVYHAMQCRLYTLHNSRRQRQKWKVSDTCFLLTGCGVSLIFRIFDITSWLGGKIIW